MQRLSGLDASFLYLETPSSYMHVAGLMILDPSTAPVEWSFDQVRDMYAQRLHLAPPFRRRLVEVPFGLHHPLWIEDPDFDLDFHLHHIAVPQPGGARHLATLAEEIVARPLDRRKPLWESWIIEGLEHGYIAVLTKTHHAAIDGVSGNEMTVAMLDTEPEGRDVRVRRVAARARTERRRAARVRGALAVEATGEARRLAQPHGFGVAQRRTPNPSSRHRAAAGSVHRAARIVELRRCPRTARTR